MVEMATGKFPYNTWGTPFEQLKQVRWILYSDIWCDGMRIQVQTLIFFSFYRAHRLGCERRSTETGGWKIYAGF